MSFGQSDASASCGGGASTLKRFNMFSNTRLQRSCPNCLNASVIILDNHTGDELCSRCGLVLEGHVLSDEQEWRSFSNTESGLGGQDRSRVSGPNNVWIDSIVQGTAMMGGDKKHSRLLQTHELATAVSGSDKILLMAFGRLKNIIDYFNLRENVLERCKEIVKDLQTMDQLRNRTGDIYMLSVTYLACREEKIPKSLSELVAYNRSIKEKELGRAINRLKKLLPLRRQPISSTAADLMPRVCQSLQLSKHITNVAEYVSRQAQLILTRGHRPSSLAAGAVYFVTQLCGLDIDAYDIAAVAKTGASTVIAVYRKSSAWGLDAHQALAMITVSGLTPKAISVTKHLLAPHDIVDSSGWTHEIEYHFPESSKLHYFLSSKKNITPGESLHVNKQNCPDDMCLVRAVQTFYKNLRTGNFSSFRCFKETKITQSDALKFFISLLGELHQPLRLGFQEDMGGRNITLYYSDASYRTKKSNLFDYVEKDLVQKIVLNRPNFWYSGWTHINTLPRADVRMIEEEWNSANEEERMHLFVKWANESFYVACDHLYKRFSKEEQLSDPEHPLNPADERYFFMLLRRQLLIGGTRTAIILNTILGHLEPTKLRHSSGFNLKGGALLISSTESMSGLSSILNAYYYYFHIFAFVLFMGLLIVAIKLYYSMASVMDVNKPYTLRDGKEKQEQKLA